jgi:putative FmdB family regulatory protein
VPLYDFACRECGERFEAQVAEAERPRCPVCGAKDPERLIAPFAGPFTTGLRGGEARRSDAARRARGEQRREEWAIRREKG